MATVTQRKKIKIPERLPVKRGAPQILWMLDRHGPQTIWEIVDRLKRQGIGTSWYNVRRSLDRLRERDRVGVVNWKEERNRIRKYSSYAWNAKEGRPYRPSDLGMVLDGIQEVEVWSIVNDDNGDI